jgi:trehalose 6-phosphate phosphatase
MRTWPDTLAALLAAHHPLLAFDFDGTLAPITEDPDHAAIPAALLDDLATLSARARVALVSGRPRTFLEERLGELAKRGITIASNFGRSEEVDEGWRARLDAAEHALRSLEAAGALIERKPTSVAIHVRRHPELAPGAAALAEELSMTSGLELQPARQAWELLVPSGASKGTALKELLAEGTDVALYAGDDVSDVAAMKALRESSVASYCIAIDSGELPEALAHVADEVISQGELHARLHHLAVAWVGHHR